MAITNLDQYYKSLGQTLPSVQQRQGTATKAGISGYTGTAEQNSSLLKYLSSNPSATAQAPVLKTPAAQQYTQSLAQGIDPNAPTSTPTTPPSGTPTTDTTGGTAQSAYLKYLTGMFDPNSIDAARKKNEDSQQRLADIQGQRDVKSLAARREYEKLLDASGGLKAGAQESATQASRRSNSELADLAVQESAAARSAGVASDTYKAYIDAGKTVYEAEQAAKKAEADAKQEAAKNNNFSLSPGEERYQLDPTTGQYTKVASGAAKPISVSDQYGTGAIGEYQFAKANGYPGTFSQYQNEDANRKKSIAAAGVAGLSPAQVNTTVNQIASALDNEPVVKEYNTIKRQVQTFNNLGNSATDDIQRVYAFAKIADPNSSVKEGEYNSIEKYSQALLSRLGLKVSRVFSPTGILTPEARLAMSKTIQTSLNSAEDAYKQVSSEYQRQIDDAYAGKQRKVTSYEVPSNSGGSNSNPLGI